MEVLNLLMIQFDWWLGHILFGLFYVVEQRVNVMRADK